MVQSHWGIICRGFIGIEVRTTVELNAPVRINVAEFVGADKQLAGRRKAVYAINGSGCRRRSHCCSAFIVATGGVGAGSVAGAAPGLTWTGAAVAGLVAAVGGTISINLIADLDHVEMPMGIKMKCWCAKSS